MKKTLLLMSCALVCTIAFATSSTLTIFSEDGHKFFLILNGQKMNEQPETNIRLQALTQAYYNCRIIFADNTIEEVSKSYLPVTDAADPNVSQDVTYKIKAGKNGKQVLRFFSAQPIQVTATQEAIAPDIAVYNYGTPTPTGPPATTVTETTTTQVSGTDVGMSVNGMNVNVQMSEPVVTGRTTTTTTTTTTYTATSTPSSPPPPAPPAPIASGPCSYPMMPSDFLAAKESLGKATFEDTKLKSAKSIISGNCLYANQVAEVCRLFTYEQSKLDFAKYAYKYCYDKNNYFKVNDVFDFDASRTELSSFITR